MNLSDLLKLFRYIVAALALAASVAAIAIFVLIDIDEVTRAVALAVGFAVMIAATTLRPAIIAILIGVPLGPIFHMVSPDWGLLATGLAGGTLAFWIHRKTSAKNT